MVDIRDLTSDPNDVTPSRLGVISQSTDGEAYRTGIDNFAQSNISSVLAYKSAEILLSGFGVDIICDEVMFDNNNEFNTTTGIFYPEFAGTYLFGFSANTNSTLTDDLYLSVEIPTTNCQPSEFREDYRSPSTTDTLKIVSTSMNRIAYISAGGSIGPPKLFSVSTLLRAGSNYMQFYFTKVG